MAGSLIDSSGPFNRFDRPAAFPWADLVNGVPDKAVFDLGVELDTKEGVAYIQVDHVIDMARSLGMVTKEEHEEALNELKEVKESTPESELERLSNVIGDLDSAIRDYFDIADPNSDVPVGDSEESTPTADSDESDSSDSDKSSVVKRSNELSGSTSNDAFGFDSLDSSN